VSDVLGVIRDIKKSLRQPSDVLGPQQKAALIRMGVDTPETLRPPEAPPEPLGYEVIVNKKPRPQMSQDIVERAKAANKAAADAKLQAILKARGAAAATPAVPEPSFNTDAVLNRTRGFGQ
jgi:hypothetical protein